MKGEAPGIILFDTVKVYGQNDLYNIDGAGGKTALTNYYLMVRDTDSAGGIIGCTAAKLG